MIYEPGIFVPWAQMVKKNVDIPVIAVGRLDEPDLAKKVLDSGYADMVAIGRGLIADPEWPTKVHEGAVETIRVCIACNMCVDNMRKGDSLRCLVNPLAGKESEFIFSTTHESKNVLVVGGGPSGLETARILSMRGHRVTLVEKKSILGGSLRLAMKAPIFQNVELRPQMIEKFIDYQIDAAKAAGVQIHSSISLDEKLIDRVDPDIVILATGAPYRFPLNFLIPLLLKSGLIRTSPFKRILKVIHQSSRLDHFFYKTLRKPNTGGLSLHRKKILEFITVGDCCQPGTTQEALCSAVKIGGKV